MHRLAQAFCLAFLGFAFAAKAQAQFGGKDAELHRLAGSLIITGFQGHSLNDPGFLRVHGQLKKGHLAGVIFFRHNIKGDFGALNQAAALRLATGKRNPPPLLAVDEEGGIVQRLRTFNVQRPLKIADMVSIEREAAFKALAVSLELNQLNLNFAPVVDLHDESSPIIAKYGRAFSAEPDQVASLAAEMIDLHREKDIATTLKHFPGHGTALGDSHNGFVDISETWTARELLPFKTLIDEGKADVVMTAHLFHSGIDSDHPATLSRAFITDILRGELGYDGVVVTDDLTMKAISDNYDLAEAVVLAVDAGVDLLLTGNFTPDKEDLAEKIRLILVEAVKSGRLSEARLQESHDRLMILRRGLR